MLKFDFARNALRYLLKEYKIREIYIPYYLCNVIRHVIFKEGTKLRFYHIDNDFFPVETFPPNSYILYPNYFGICGKNVNKLSKLYPQLIIDNAHAFYAEPQGFASFNSAKKFLPVESGAYLLYKGEKNTFLPDFERRKVFDSYHKHFSASNKLKIDIDNNSIPFCYPYLAETIEEADKLAYELIGKGLEIYRYWNNLPESYNEYKFYSRLVPIPLNRNKIIPELSNSIQQDSLLRQTGVQGI